MSIPYIFHEYNLVLSNTKQWNDNSGDKELNTGIIEDGRDILRETA